MERKAYLTSFLPQHTIDGVQRVERFRMIPKNAKKAEKSLYQDAKYIIQYCKDSVTRAKNAMQEDTNVIRIGTSPMTSAQLLMQIWPKIQMECPDFK